MTVHSVWPLCLQFALGLYDCKVKMMLIKNYIPCMPPSAAAAALKINIRMLVAVLSFGKKKPTKWHNTQVFNT